MYTKICILMFTSRWILISAYILLSFVYILLGDFELPILFTIRKSKDICKVKLCLFSILSIVLEVTYQREENIFFLHLK